MTSPLKCAGSYSEPGIARAIACRLRVLPKFALATIFSSFIPSLAGILADTDIRYAFMLASGVGVFAGLIAFLGNWTVSKPID